MQNFYHVRIFVDAVVDQDWRMHELTGAEATGLPT